MARMLDLIQKVHRGACDVVDEKERLVARASSTCMTLRGGDAKGR